MSDAFEKVTYRGRLMDRKTMAFCQAMEAALGYPLTIVQGCYNPGGVTASGGTHDGGGVFDLAAYDWQRKVKVAADLGGFPYHRTYIQGLWGEHVHIGIRDHGRLSQAAQAQQRDWDHHPPLDALVDHAVWRGYHPGKQITFQYPVKEAPVAVPETNITKARDALVQAIHSIGDAAALVSEADQNRPKSFDTQIAALKTEHKDLRAILKSLPEK